jgi:hypothetical protein
MRKRIEASPLFDRQAVGKPPMHFPTGLKTHFDTKSFEHHGTWKNDPALPALLQDEGGQMNQALVLNGTRQQPCRQFGGGTPPKWTEPQFVAKLSGMGSAIPLSSEIFADRFRENPNLFGNECEERFWRSFPGTERTAGIT